MPDENRGKTQRCIYIERSAFCRERIFRQEGWRWRGEQLQEGLAARDDNVDDVDDDDKDDRGAKRYF